MVKKAKTKLVNKGTPQLLLHANFDFDYSLLHTDTLMGREHIVMPVVMLVEGVHVGSGGPVYYSEEVISTFVEMWNGRPVTVKHPEMNGQGVSACGSPEIMDFWVIGTVLNAEFDDGKLKAEVWIDKERLYLVSEETAAWITDGKPLEVSTGLYTYLDDTPGVWNGEEFIATVLAAMPDHLALLPGQRGACSCGDGCGGPRLNAEGDVDVKKQGKQKLIETLNRRITVQIGNIDVSHDELRSKLWGVVNSLDTPTRTCYLDSVYDAFFIYEAVPAPGLGEYKLLRQGYHLDADGQVVLDGEPVEVVRSTSYTPVNNSVASVTEGDQLQNSEKEEDMAKQGKKDKKAMIGEIIANGVLGFTKDSETILNNMTDCQITQIHAQIGNEGEEEVKTEPKAEEPKAPTVNAAPAAGFTLEELQSVLLTAVRNEVSSALTQLEREPLVAALLENKSCPFTKERLNTMDIEELKALNNMINPAPDYRGLGGFAPISRTDNAEDDSVDMPAVLLAEPKASK